MGKIFIPEGYHSPQTIRDTEISIKQIKDYFERALAEELNLTRVSAPLFVKPETGLNDNLNGVERAVAFGIKEQQDAIAEIVHSLAKWKRMALHKYEFGVGEGLYTDMSAIRRDEETDNLHSIYVDQWDWEKVIAKEERTIETLQATVRSIYRAIYRTQEYYASLYSWASVTLPKEITFISSQELEDRYPEMTVKERENEICKQHGAVFVMQIGGKLRSGKPHDGRAPDYDDWSLNGDILVYYPLLDLALELSSMGIRVDEESLRQQLAIAGCMERAQLPFQKALMEGKLPYTIGGGIGQSRLCMFYMQRAHIGEVQSSLWPEEVQETAKSQGIHLL